jgi:hypothetical protein
MKYLLAAAALLAIIFASAAVITRCAQARPNCIGAHSRPVVFLTHHVISRMAQRFGLCTPEHMHETMRLVWNAAASNMKNEGWHKWAEIPEEGWRRPLAKDVLVVLKRHPTRRALIAATVFGANES